MINKNQPIEQGKEGAHGFDMARELMACKSNRETRLLQKEQNQQMEYKTYIPQRKADAGRGKGNKWYVPGRRNDDEQEEENQGRS